MASATPDGGALLWDQSTLAPGHWIDQTFTDFPDFDTFQVCDISTGSFVVNVNKVTVWYTQGALPDSNWSPATITTGSLNVFPKTGPLPVDGTDVPPELTIPITLTDIGAVWEITADTSGVAELQCISGDFWIGITPNSTFATDGQEFRYTTPNQVGDESALVNFGGDIILLPIWVPLSTLDPGGAFPTYDSAIRLEGDILTPTWTEVSGTGITSTVWGSTPELNGSGIACAGQTVTLDGMFNGSPPDVTSLVIGPLLMVPLKDGVMVPDPALIIPIPVGPVGDFELAAPWPGGLPPGFSFFFQTWTNEVGGSAGWSASDGLEVVSQ